MEFFWIITIQVSQGASSWSTHTRTGTISVVTGTTMEKILEDVLKYIEPDLGSNESVILFFQASPNRIA
jgi:hypothetical protein